MNIINCTETKRTFR